MCLGVGATAGSSARAIARTPVDAISASSNVVEEVNTAEDDPLLCTASEAK